MSLALAARLAGVDGEPGRVRQDLNAIWYSYPFTRKAGTMVQKIDVQLVDDIDGSEAAENVKFALDGFDYEIDLSAQNAAALRSVLADYIASGRRKQRDPAGTERPRARTGQGRTDPKVARMRAWAEERGLRIGKNGRIPAYIEAEYDAAHPRPAS